MNPAGDLAQLIRAAQPLRVCGRADIPISGLCHDSRRLNPGELFFALPGSKTDGNRHVKKALELGAAAVVSELDPPPPPIALKACWIQVRDALEAMGLIADSYYGHPSQALTIIGVTGTNGKTTTTYFLESIISACGGLPAVAGTVDYRINGAVLQKASNTTPISLELIRLLARFRDGGATHAALEVSSHALALKRVETIDFDAAVFTNIGRDHLDFHKTPEDYFRAKSRLFELLSRADSAKKRRVAAINADDPRAASLKRLVLGPDLLLFGLKNSADLRAENIALSHAGSRFDLVYRGRRIPARLSLVGEHNIYNALGAAAACLGLGMAQEEVVRGLQALRSVPGRLENVADGREFSVFVDYAHTPDALEAVLTYLRRLPHGRLITVFGCGGERDRGKRAAMGVAACRLSDWAIITSDNPRGEEPLAIIKDIEGGLKTAGLKNYKIVAQRLPAIEEAVAQARNGDIILIAGKGHEDYQILRDRTIHFDDREAARAAIMLKKTAQ